MKEQRQYSLKKRIYAISFIFQLAANLLFHTYLIHDYVGTTREISRMTDFAQDSETASWTIATLLDLSQMKIDHLRNSLIGNSIYSVFLIVYLFILIKWKPATPVDHARIPDISEEQP